MHPGRYFKILPRQMAFHTSGDAGGVHCFGGAGPRPPFVGPRSSAHRPGFGLTRLNYVCLASRWFRSSCVFAMLYDFIYTQKKKKGQVTALPNGSVSMARVTTFSPEVHYMGSGKSCNPFYFDHTTYLCYFGAWFFDFVEVRVFQVSGYRFQTSATGTLLRRKL